MNWKQYFVFTRKERVGILIISMVLIIINALPYVLPNKKLNILIDDIELPPAAPGKEQTPVRSSEAKFAPTLAREYETFYFDPNKVDQDGWRRLGLRDKTISTILNFKRKGGRFRQAEDLRKVYGIRQEELKRLLPFVRIIENVDSESYKKQAATPQAGFSSNIDKTRRYAIIDVNNADTSDLIALPGIGSKLAKRIILFREKLGGFLRVDQIGEVYGLHDSTFRRITPYLTCSSTAVKRIDLNKASLEQLQQHPYISKNMARVIISYREQHGLYKSVEQLKNIEGINSEDLRKVIDYVSTE